MLEHIYIGRQLDVGNPAATKRWESMTFDGPGGAIFDTFESLSGIGTDGNPQILTLRQAGRAGTLFSHSLVLRTHPYFILTFSHIGAPFSLSHELHYHPHRNSVLILTGTPFSSSQELRSHLHTGAPF